MIKRFLSISLLIVLALVVTTTFVFQTDVDAATFTITVNSGTSTGPLKYGGIGWLYGLGENNYIPDEKITGLVHPQYSGQKAPWGAQHPVGDALNVATQAKRVGMKGIDIYVQDYYADWPYPEYGVNSYINNVVDPVIDSVLASNHQGYMRYVPFNEPDWIWYSNSGSELQQFFNDWKLVYDYIRSRDPQGEIIGPGFMSYNAAAYDAFMKFARDNNCLPDVVSWHTLENSFFTGYYNDYNHYRSVESKYGISPREVYINEYGRQGQDIPRPGNLIQYLARFENTKVYAAMAFWTGGNKLDDLLTDEGPGNGRETGAYWLYQWYGQMTGNTVDVDLPSTNGPLQAIASRDGTNNVRVIFGGSANSGDVNTINVVVKGLSSGTVNYEIYETNYTTGYHAQPGVRSSGTATVSGGQVNISVSNAKALSAYLVKITPGSGLPDTVRLQARHSSRCVDVYGGSTADGADVIQWECHNNANQQWQFENMGSGYYRLKVQHSNKCLDVYAGGTADGTNVIQWECHTNNNQQWSRDDMGDGYFRLRNRNSDKCLDVYEGGTSNGATLVQWTCHNNYNQQWREY